MPESILESVLECVLESEYQALELLDFRPIFAYNSSNISCFSGKYAVCLLIFVPREPWHSRGQRFDPAYLRFAVRNRTLSVRLYHRVPHQKSPETLRFQDFFCVFGDGEYLFFTDGKNRNERHFRESIFYPVLQQLGIDTMNPDGTHRYTPHCCRHTFATLMKKVDAPATDKQKLIGHRKFEMTAYYTHTDLDSLKKITDNL